MVDINYAEAAPKDVYPLLVAWSEGDGSALEKTIAFSRGRVAPVGARYERERKDHNLQTTALVNEAY